MITTNCGWKRSAWRFFKNSSFLFHWKTNSIRVGNDMNKTFILSWIIYLTFSVDFMRIMLKCVCVFMILCIGLSLLPVRHFHCTLSPLFLHLWHNNILSVLLHTSLQHSLAVGRTSSGQLETITHASSPSNSHRSLINPSCLTVKSPCFALHVTWNSPSSPVNNIKVSISALQALLGEDKQGWLF